jgi:hypothetical protein
LRSVPSVSTSLMSSRCKAFTRQLRRALSSLGSSSRASFRSFPQAGTLNTHTSPQLTLS